MITNKKMLKEFLRADKTALGISHKSPRFMRDFEWKYEIVLRKAEYYSNKKLSFYKFYYLFKLRHYQLKFNTFIPMHVCGKGLSIAHIGGIRINSNAKIGDYFRIQEGVTIGATNGSNSALTIGNYVYVGSGAKIIGEITVCDGCCIGAGAVVVKNITEKGTYVGVPAKKVNEHTSYSNLLIGK